MFIITAAATAAVFLIFTLVARAAGNRSALSPLRIVVIFLLAFLGGWFAWLARPAIGPDFPALWIWLIAVTLAGPFVAAGGKVRTSMFIPLFLATAAVLVMWAANGRLLRSSSFRSLMEENITATEPIDFTADVEPVDIGNLRVVDQSLARQRGATLIESIPGLGSQVELGTMSIQNLNGSFDVVSGSGDPMTLTFSNELVWAGVLHPSGAFKEAATPGYIIVSALDAGRAFFVTSVGGEALSVNYSTGHYFSGNLLRHLRANGYLNRGIADFTFELSDLGQPYYVVTLFEKRIGWNGADATGAVVVDVQTGEITEYGIDEAPSFIDRIQPEDFITVQLDDWGRLVHGWFNSWIKQKDVLTKTAGTSLVYSGGEAYFYSGIQSAGSDRGTTGFVLVNTRTKKTKMYRISGISEDRAAEALENAKGVREAGYYSTSPILYNIGSRPVYFSTLKGSDGLVKMYGFISLKNEQVLGVGTTVRDALRAFETSLINSSDSFAVDSAIEEVRLEAPVAAVAGETISGMTYYYLMLEGYPEIEFFGSSDSFRELKWTVPGDPVEVVYPAGDLSSVSIRSFDNRRVLLDNN